MLLLRASLASSWQRVAGHTPSRSSAEGRTALQAGQVCMRGPRPNKLRRTCIAIATTLAGERRAVNGTKVRCSAF